jgi:serine/threonine-protein phosphatase 5
MQAHPFYDFEQVIDSDEELDLIAMDSGTSSLS